MWDVAQLSWSARTAQFGLYLLCWYTSFINTTPGVWRFIDRQLIFVASQRCLRYSKSSFVNLQGTNSLQLLLLGASLVYLVVLPWLFVFVGVASPSLSICPPSSALLAPPPRVFPSYPPFSPLLLCLIPPTCVSSPNLSSSMCFIFQVSLYVFQPVLCSVFLGSTVLFASSWATMIFSLKTQLSILLSVILLSVPISPVEKLSIRVVNKVCKTVFASVTCRSRYLEKQTGLCCRSVIWLSSRLRTFC